MLILALLTVTSATAEKLGIGTPISPQQLERLDTDVRGSDGAGLPPGFGTPTQGREIFLSSCAMCHGTTGEGSENAPALKGGVGSLPTTDPLKTIGSFWPYASTIFDYVRRAMPAHAPRSLTNDEVYAITAYLLYINGIVPEDIIISQSNLPRVVMPNWDGFIPDDREKSERKFWKKSPCVRNCAPIASP